MYQQPGQYSFQQPPPQFQPVFQQPTQPVFPTAAPVQPSPQPASTHSGTSDAMMPLLMSESRQHQNEVRQAITKVSEKIDSLEHKVWKITITGSGIIFYRKRSRFNYEMELSNSWWNFRNFTVAPYKILEKVICLFMAFFAISHGNYQIFNFLRFACQFLVKHGFLWNIHSENNLFVLMYQWIN